MKKTKYLVLADLPETGSWEEGLQRSVGICHTLKRAYEIALFLAGISKPKSSYRKILKVINAKGAATLEQQEGPQRATIVVTKIY